MSGFCQIIKGKITNTKGEKIITANIFIKDSLETENFLDFVVARNGEYQIELKENYTRFILYASAIGYADEYFELGGLEKNAVYIRDFVLRPESEKIEEIVVISEKLPVVVSEDTTKFRVKSFSDGSERKIEEIIKKLPGMQVNEQTGEIKYKNKTIETIKLDGDDLFGANYTIGSRNINVNMVEEIQAIENYSENPLLKGIENSDKVILNLKLNEGIKISGNVDFGQGLMAERQFARDISTTLLTISKKYKSFASLSYNNIGVNRSPFNYFNSFNYNPEDFKEKDFFAPKLIDEQGFATILDEKRVRINRTLFGSYNQTFKINSKTHLRGGLYYISDNISSIQLLLNEIRLANTNLVTTDQLNIRKQPLRYSGDIELKANTTTLSLLKYEAKFKYENISTPSNVTQNDTNFFRTYLQTNDLYLKQAVTFTQKISERKALQAFFTQSHNRIGQDFSIFPAVYAPDLHSQENQKINTQQNTLESYAIFLGSTPKSKYTASLGTNLQNTSLLSSLQGSVQGNNVIVEDFVNHFIYQKNSFFSKLTYFVKLRKWSLNLLHSANWLNQSFQEPALGQKQILNTLLLEPSAALLRRLTPLSSIKFIYHYRQEPFTEQYLYRYPIFNSVRQGIRNIPQLEFTRQHRAKLLYIFSSLDEQFLFDYGGSYGLIMGNYFADLNIESNRTQLIYFYSPQNTTNINFFGNIEKFFYKALVLMKLNLNYDINTYNNILNGSELRQNRLHFFSSRLEFRTGFNTKVNFSNIVFYGSSISSNQGTTAFRNDNLNNTFTALFKKNKTSFFALTLDTFIPDVKNLRQNYTFFDVQYRFKIANFDIDIACKNIFNKNNFEQIRTYDYGVSVFRVNLLPRYGLLKISCNF